VSEYLVNTGEYTAAARRLHEAGPAVQKAFGNAIREVAKPLGRDVLITGAARMPRRGGLAYRIASANVTVQATAMRAQITLRTRERYDLKALDRGVLRHPVFEHEVKRTTRIRRRRVSTGQRLWVEQRVPANAFSDPFEAAAPMIRAKVLAATQRALSEAVGT
jgi:hypothetical protein